MLDGGFGGVAACGALARERLGRGAEGGRVGGDGARAGEVRSDGVLGVRWAAVGAMMRGAVGVVVL